ncbi:uncharacterized protein CLAFUR5_07023 [Fulvia fulva]|uniref:JmjC domain-containing protein n=1 Tax=Passalora fulva TaxID=5499 RepID=A0A9Q8P9X2_PASFU|nr:uncharacterized protein CLAFUR5_07023 [Fulvia fulva]KAK4623245.1 hypothetical protein CLAFUR0_06890 [Fulvia fulva]UJO18575.1 hypothetical protein CLAFUR5_07023 [Fulvia fulva]
MEPVHQAAHTDALSMQKPSGNDSLHPHQASAWNYDDAHTAAKEARNSPVDSLLSANGKVPDHQIPQAPRLLEHAAASHDSLGHSESVERMDIARVVAPELPAEVVITLPVGLEDGSSVETQSFPTTESLHGCPPQVTRLIPSVVPQGEESDCSTVANPWFAPTRGVVCNSLHGTYARPTETFTSSVYSPSSTFLPATNGDAIRPRITANTQPPVTAGTFGSMHTPEVSGDARVEHDSQSAQHNPTDEAPAAVKFQEEATTTTSSLDGTSPETISTVEEAATPRDGSMPAQTRSKAPPLSQTPEPAANGTALAAGLYGRERNQKRAATKAYRQPITPRALRSADSKKPAECASSSSAASTETTKRAAPEFGSPKEKRQRLSSTAASTRARRATHPVDADERKSQVPQQAWESVPAQSDTSIRPIRDVEGDRRYVAQLQEVLEVRGKARKADMGRRQAARINDLLNLASYPTADEGLFLTREEATDIVASGKFFNGPIFTEGQQALPLQTVSQFCDEYYDDDTMVWIQDPEIKPTKKAQIARQVKMRQVKSRLAGPLSDKPWNCLELATHSDDGLKPSFLNTEDCRLLTKLKIPDTQDKPEARRRAYLPGYKEVEKWALLAQAGALTEPHQDSHGYSTYITINQGLVGYGWLSFPTDEERAAWRRNPDIFRGGRWRYVILKPGQTVYFPAGTVHFVFRLPDGGNTLAFGGHVLRCSNIVHWVKTLIEERNAKDVTNEDLTESAPGYLARVEKFVKQARITGQEAKWGGEESITEFLRLKEEFLKRKQK